jgi:hypothetical protein
MENTMDEELINKYINVLATKVNELNQENILLKAKLAVAQDKINVLTVEQEDLEDNYGNGNKAKTK